MALSRGGTTRTKCPYCFVDLNLKNVAFRCSGIAAAGKQACVTYPDPVRTEVVGDGTPVLPPVLLRRGQDRRHVIDERGMPLLETGRIGSSKACDRCGGKTSVPICGNCHSILPDGIEGGNISISVLGVRNSGKTVFLSALDQQLLTSMTQRFHASIDHPGGTVQLADDLARYYAGMAQEKRLPDQTASDRTRKRPPSVYSWRWVQTGEGKIISVYDTAGEDLVNRDVAMSQLHLGAANAVFLVLDPFLLPENIDKARQRRMDVGAGNEQMNTLDGITTTLRQWEAANGRSKGGNKIQMPLAVIVTKMDAFRSELPPHSPLCSSGSAYGNFDDEESLTIHDHLRAQLEAWGGAAVTRKIEADFASFRYFSVSALGNEPDYTNGQLMDRPSPTHVVDPLLWILAREKFVGTVDHENRG